MVGFVCVQRVAGVTDSWWLSMLILPPLFKDSPASPFLSAYYPDCVGMSPSASPEHRRAAPSHSESEPDRVSSHCFHDPHNDLIQTLHAESLFFMHCSSLGKQTSKIHIEVLHFIYLCLYFSLTNTKLYNCIPLFILKVC